MWQPRPPPSTVACPGLPREMAYAQLGELICALLKVPLRLGCSGESMISELRAMVHGKGVIALQFQENVLQQRLED